MIIYRHFPLVHVARTREFFDACGREMNNAAEQAITAGLPREEFAAYAANLWVVHRSIREDAIRRRIESDMRSFMGQSQLDE